MNTNGERNYTVKREEMQKLFDDFVLNLFHDVLNRFGLTEKEPFKLYHDTEFCDSCDDYAIDVRAHENGWLKHYVQQPFYSVAYSFGITLRENPLERPLIIAICYSDSTCDSYSDVICSIVECRIDGLENAKDMMNYIRREIFKFGLDNGFYEKMFDAYKKNNPDSLFDFHYMLPMFVSENDMKYTNVMLSKLDIQKQLEIIDSFLKLFESYSENDKPLESIAWFLSKQHELIKHRTGADEMNL